ncbi:MAG: peptidase [Vampirovibrio sp.]|nr:peptidase [Vampirovibrio sp.]
MMLYQRPITLPPMVTPLPAVPPPSTLASPAMNLNASAATSYLTVPLMNGATGHFLQAPDLRTCALRVQIPMEGVTPGSEQLLVQMLSEGSESTKHILAQLENRGIQILLGNVDNRLTVFASAPSAQAGAMVQAVLNLLRNPIVDPAAFNTVQGKLLHQVQGLFSDPDIRLSTAMSKQIYGPRHTFSRTPQETFNSVAGQTLAGMMAQYGQMLQRPDAVQMLLVSPQPVSLQQQWVNDAIPRAGWFRDPYRAIGAGRELPLPNPQGDRRPVLVPNDSLQRALVQVTWKTPDVRDPDYPAYLLLREILRGYSKGSFFQTLRTDHGLVYRIVQSSSSRLAQGQCYDVSMELDFNRIQQALADVDAVTQELCRNPVTPAQMETMKRKLLLENREMRQSADGVANQAMPWFNLGLPPIDSKQLEAALAQVDAPGLQRAANRIFNPAYGFRLVGVSAPRAILQQTFPTESV